MKKTAMALLLAVLPVLALSSCEDQLSNIGGSLVNSEVTISVDSLVADIHGESVREKKFDARTTTKLLGRLSVPEYGSLSCSFVTQLMSATKMNIPDSITEEMVDSARLVLSIPRGSLTGDSLAPQQLKVFRLTSQIPDTVSSSFDAKGYYDPQSPMGVKSYTVSNISMSDSAFKKRAYVSIPVKLPKEFGMELFRKYRANDPMFQWPSEFNKWFPGIYVEQNFGNGCVANITKAETFLYWHRTEKVAVPVDSATVKYEMRDLRDSVCLMSSRPEVVSSNNIDYIPSETLDRMAGEGKALVTTPGGYIVNVKFPVGTMLKKYLESNTEMSVVAKFTLEIPGKIIKNDYGIRQAPYLLMVPAAERESFFRENKIPDNETSFYASYDEETGTYRFDKLRAYFLKRLEDYRAGKITEFTDEEFAIVPVMVSTETVQNYDSSTTYVLRVSPYMSAPTMTELDTRNATIIFTFSSQKID